MFFFLNVDPAQLVQPRTQVWKKNGPWHPQAHPKKQKKTLKGKVSV
jgi:hypothetical protein